MKIRTCLLLAALAAVGCGSGESKSDASTGSGGRSAPVAGTIARTGGSIGNGGAIGTGGTTAASTVDASMGTGGSPGIDASTSKGGSTGIDGSIGTGGTIDAGAIDGLVDVPNTGGSIGNGGAIGTGGTTAASTVDASMGTGGSTSIDGSIGTGGTVDAGGIDGLVDAPSTGGIVGNGGSIGTGGNIGSGGIAGTGGTTSSNSAPTCPLGTWKLDLGYALCGSTNFTSVSTITQTSSGGYVIVSVSGPLHASDVSVGQEVCEMMTLADAAPTYTNGVFVSKIEINAATCPQKVSTSTMTINSTCTQASVKNVFANCETCDNKGNCSGCGSKTCIAELGTAIRSF